VLNATARQRLMKCAARSGSSLSFLKILDGAFLIVRHDLGNLEIEFLLESLQLFCLGFREL